MALTNAERQKKYRERMQFQNPAKYAEIKAKNAERNKKRKKIKECSKEVVELKRKQWRDSQNRRRKKTEDAVPNLDTNNATDHGSDGTKIAVKRSMDAVRKRLMRKWADQKNLYEDNIKSMATQIKSLKKKCKRVMQTNKKLMNLVDELKLKVSEPHVVIQNDNEMTPLSKSSTFIEENLPNISKQEKETVKRQLLTHNVLVNAIQDTYMETKKNHDRTILKTIIDNKIVTKYNKKCEITYAFGLKGRVRKNKIELSKNNVIINEIIKFYNRDDVSKATAGKQEFKTKHKIRKQRRYLLNSLKELYKKYREGGGRAKRTMFIKYKPFYVLPPKLSDRETCGCVKHENFFMKIKKFNSLGMIETTDLNEILSEVVCDLDSKECAYGECSTCSNDFIKFNGDTWDMNENVIWNEYAMARHKYINKNDGKTVSTKKMVKKEIQGKLKSLTESFNEELKMMTKHVFNIKHQYSQYLSCVNNLKPTEVAIHIDFSENYVCKLTTEVQSMHFGASKQQITIHTGIVYVKGQKPQSFASISPSNEHGPEAIWAHLKPVLHYVRKEYPLANAVHYFSDGPVTQYKQKKNFYFFMKYMKDMGFPRSTWNFSESAHGKGAADGVGGGLKRRLDDFVKHGIDIPDAYTAYTLLTNSDTTVMTFYVQEADIGEYSVEENLTPVPQTMNLHQIINTETSIVLRYRCLSCFCGDSHRGYCKCFEVKNHRLVKIITNQNENNKTNESHLKTKRSGDDETTQVKKKAKVNVLSDVAYKTGMRRIRFQNLQNIDKEFNLFSAHKENKNYDNPVPSTSRTVNKTTRATAKKSNLRGLVTKNSDDSSTDEDIQYSVHDSSEGDFYEELSSDTEQGTLEHNINKNANDNETVKELEKYDNWNLLNTSTEGTVENNTNENANDKETAKELEKYDNWNLLNTSTEGTVENTTNENANDNETLKENLEKNDNCSLLNISIAGIEANEKDTTMIKMNNETEELYNINDSVIVRYFLKKKWKYYIGFVEKKSKKENRMFYTIRFLKTVNSPTLRFIATRKVDRDVVPAVCIVKKVELVFDSKEYLLKHDDDCVNHIYF